MCININISAYIYEILDLPVEIDNNFDYNKEDLEPLGDRFLNNETELINNEHFCTTLNENVDLKNNSLNI